MTVIGRTFASIPTRSACETWEAIVDLIAPDTKSAARRELDAVAGTACSCIADEALVSDPLVVYGSGPRLRVYALYGDAAIEGDGANESPLSFVPTDGDWHMSIPCLSEDLDWVERSLKAVSRHVRARAQGEQLEEDRDDARSAGTSLARNGTAAPVLVNRDAFFRR
jgi:hypothetical protein